MEKLMQKRESLIRQIEDCSEFLRGSITFVCSTCNRAKCICTIKSNRKAYRLTYKDANQKSHTLYISKEQLPKARKMVDKYAKIRKLIDEIQTVNISLFKLEGKN